MRFITIDVRRGGTRLGVAVLFAVLTCAASAATGQGGLPAEGPIERLTAESRERALECGRAGEACAITPYELCEKESAIYSIRLITPFSRVAKAALEAQQDGRPLGRMGAVTVNRLGIGLSVAPAQHSAAAAAIERVAVQREGRLIQPIRVTVGALTTEAADGTTKKLARGFFLFPAGTFQASSDVRIVLAGPSGQISCTLDRSQLLTLQ